MPGKGYFAILRLDSPLAPASTRPGGAGEFEPA
jgi:hypothetical protein